MNQQVNNPFMLALQSNNPIAFIQNAAQHNPQVKQALEMFNQISSATPEQQQQIVQKFCQDKGINFDNALQQYQQFMNSKTNNN